MRKVGIRPRRLGHSLAGRSWLPGSGDRGGGAFLPDIFADARQWVEVAFGADLTADPDTWSWTNLAFRGGDVQWDPGVEIQIGYPDEVASLVPASFTCDLLNNQANGGDYTLGNALGKRWPNIRENTPIRSRLDIGNGPTTRFFGYATSWKPFRGPGGKKLVKLLANGVSRRIRQGTAAKKSAMRRSYDYGTVTPTAYWSLEGGAGATTSYDTINNLPTEQVDQSAAVAGQSGAVKFGTVHLGDGSDLVANIAGSWSLGLRLQRPFSTTGTYSIQFHQNHGTEVRSGGSVVTGIRMDPTAAVRHLTFQFYVYDDKTCQLDVIEAFSDLSVAAGPTTLFTGVSVGNIFDGEGRAFQVNLSASGGTNVAWQVWMNGSSLGSGTHTPSFAGSMNGGVYRVATLASSIDAAGTVGVGHFAVFPQLVTANRATPLGGHRGETPDDRLTRVFAEQSVILDLTGTSDIAMGPQQIGTFTDIITDSAKADAGVLLDGLGPGYTYVCRTQAYSSSPQLTLSASDGDLPGELEGQHDDRFRNNDFTGTNHDGLERHFSQATGDLGTNTVGTYDDSDTISTNSPDDLYQHAAWRVAQGTVPGLRWPRLEFQLSKPITATKAQQWLDARPLARIDVTDIDTGGNPDRSLLLRGWNEKWNSKLWRVAANTTPYDAFAVVVLAEDAGGTGYFIGWLDTDGSTTQNGIDVGATSVVILTPSGPVWTNATTPSPNYADDITGLYINLDGLRVGVTAITGAASPQTFTLVGADVLRAVPPGASVIVANPVLLGL